MAGNLEVAEVFRRHGPQWRAAQAGHLDRMQARVMGAIEACRTAALGGHVRRCADSGHVEIAYNSCRNRHCPKCQGAARAAWVAARRAELLPSPTSSSASPRLSTPASCTSSASSHARRRRGVRRPLPRAAPDRLGGLRQAALRGARAGARLSRALHRVAIANSRLVGMADGKVSFRWKDYRHAGRQKVMTLDAGEFMRRFLLHVLPPGFHRIRHFGFLANGARAARLVLCRRLLARPAPDNGASVADAPTRRPGPTAPEARSPPSTTVPVAAARTSCARRSPARRPRQSRGPDEGRPGQCRPRRSRARDDGARHATRLRRPPAQPHRVAHRVARRHPEPVPVHRGCS